MNVLIIDDDPLVTDMYALKLKGGGFNVDVAADGKKGIGKIKEKNYDAVLLDVVLPGMDGFEVLEAITREVKNHPPIILLTNLGQKEDVEKGLKLGAVDYLIKADFTPSEVVEKISSVLRKSPAAG